MLTSAPWGWCCPLVRRGRHDVLGVKVAQFGKKGNLHDGRRGGHGHDGPEVARGLAIKQVAPAVGLVRFDQGEVGSNRVLEHIVTPLDGSRLFSVGERGAVARRSEERPNPRARRADALGEVSLGHEFELDFSRVILLVEVPRVDLAGERANHFAHGSTLDEQCKAFVGVPGVVVHNREAGKVSAQESVDQVDGLTGQTEATDHDGRSIGNVGEYLVDRIAKFVDHVSPVPIVRIANIRSIYEHSTRSLESLSRRRRGDGVAAVANRA